MGGGQTSLGSRWTAEEGTSATKRSGREEGKGDESSAVRRGVRGSGVSVGCRCRVSVRGLWCHPAGQMGASGSMPDSMASSYPPTFSPTLRPPLLCSDPSLISYRRTSPLPLCSLSLLPNLSPPPVIPCPSSPLHRLSHCSTATDGLPSAHTATSTAEGKGVGGFCLTDVGQSPTVSFPVHRCCDVARQQ